METREDPIRHGLRTLENWIGRQVDGHWPDAETSYRGRGKNGDHYWNIRVPTVGNFWIAATESVLGDPDDIRAAEDTLGRIRWLDRLPAAPTRGVLLKDNGRVLVWDPETDETFGYFA